MNIPKPIEREQPLYQWSSHELKRELSPLVIQLPEDVLPVPEDEKKRILQSGFFEPQVIRYGLIGVTRRLLQYYSILKTTYPFCTDIIGVSDIPPEALDMLRERNDTINELSLTELVSNPNVDWIFVGSMYNQIANNIATALEAGKNVFCEKPVCFR